MEFIIAFDKLVIEFISNIQNPILDFIMKCFHYLGYKGLVWILIAVFLLLKKKWRFYGVSMIVAVLLSYILGEKVIKEIFQRPRPFVELENLRVIIEKPDTYSFPSGSSAMAFAGAAILIKFFKEKKMYKICIFGSAFIIAMTRVYFQVHYLTDVIGGILLGFFIGWGTMKVFKVGELMKKSFKKIFSFIMGLALVSSFCMPGPSVKEVEAAPVVGSTFNYVALGDSVSYGRSASTDKGYTDLLSDYFSDLDKYEADFITINIGVENLISPFIKTIARIYNVFTDINAPSFKKELYTAIEANPDQMELIINLIDFDNTHNMWGDSLSSDLNAGVICFKNDFTKIISEIKALAPNAEIHVNTIYDLFSYDYMSVQVFGNIFPF